VSWSTMLVANVDGPCARGRVSHLSGLGAPHSRVHGTIHKQPRRQVEAPGSKPAGRGHPGTRQDQGVQPRTRHDQTR
jgi:hypothetical protein